MIVEKFVYSKIPTVYFGEEALKDAMKAEIKHIGENVLIAYGGGSIKKNHIFDSIKNLLEENNNWHCGCLCSSRDRRGSVFFIF